MRCCIAELADIGCRGITAGDILITGVWLGPAAAAISATGCWWPDVGTVVEAAVPPAPCRAWDSIARCCTGTDGCAAVEETPDVEFDVDAD